ncbi:MAG: class I SAM-dependent methyltransferase [Hyphomonadaceae bacterium]|nr:class I SAM-dependent methyltransferase [Hyphomonadaceae bacterium]
MTNSETSGWDASADAWIADQGEHGDFGRRYVLDSVMLARALALKPETALDLGCGEGRFCRMLARHGVDAAGIDPTARFIEAARERHPDGRYLQSAGERLPFADAAFDLTISYLSLIDIAELDRAVAEMVRVTRPGGALLIANLNSFNTAAVDGGWIRDEQGRKLYFPIDRYLEPRAVPLSYRGINVTNYHRPLSTYMKHFLEAGCRLTFFDEPSPVDGAPEPKATAYRRAPHFLVMEWRRER